MSRIIDPPSGSDSYELRAGMDIFEKYRYVYGYVGATIRLSGPRNTSTSFLCRIVVEIGWVDDGPPYPENRCCFARAMAYSADFADKFIGSEFTVSIRDFAQCMITAPHSNRHTGPNLKFWRFANMAE